MFSSIEYEKMTNKRNELVELYRLEQTMLLHSPNKINRTEINGKIYATDENGKGLYLLVPQNIARFDGEGALIDESFKLRKGLKKETIKKKIAERVAEL